MTNRQHKTSEMCYYKNGTHFAPDCSIFDVMSKTLPVGMIPPDNIKFTPGAFWVPKPEL